MATGSGLKLVRKADGGEIRVRPYVCPAADGTALYQGDVVELTSTGTIDATTQLPTITRATSGHVLLGVVVGFEADPTAPYTSHYRIASTRRIAYVCDDPDAVYQAQEDAVGGSVSAANVGSLINANIVVANGSTVTGLSGTMIDSSTVTASAADVKIIGVVRDDQNVVASTSILECMILAPAIRATDSLT